MIFFAIPEPRIDLSGFFGDGDFDWGVEFGAVGFLPERNAPVARRNYHHQNALSEPSKGQIVPSVMQQQACY